jgi:DNA-binding response OmpR family regulator
MGEMAPRILIVDDEMYLAKILQFSFEHEGYEVIVAHDGRQALDIARREHPALVILDLMLPEIDGYRVCNTLKADPEFRDVSIVIISARDLARERIDGKICADRFIEKPFDVGSLVDTVAELLRRGITGA